MRSTHLIDGERWEYITEPTEGFSVNDGGPWWGSHVRYRREGDRKWLEFNLVDIHSWDIRPITRAIEYAVWRAAELLAERMSQK